MAVLENEKIERHIMKNVPGGYNLFVQDKEVATLIENLYSVRAMAIFGLKTLYIFINLLGIVAKDMICFPFRILYHSQMTRIIKKKVVGLISP